MRLAGLWIVCLVTVSALVWFVRSPDAPEALPIHDARVGEKDATQPEETVELASSAVADADREPARISRIATDVPEATRRADHLAVHGRLVDEDGVPLVKLGARLVTCSRETASGVTVTVGSEAEPIASVMTDIRGRFVLEFRLPSDGRVTHVVVAASSGSRTLCERDVYVGHGQVDVPLGDVEVPGRVTLSGRVRDAGGTPIGGEVVRVSRAASGGTMGPGSRGTTLPDGTFEITTAPPGRIVLRAELADGRITPQMVLLAAPGDRIDGIELLASLYRDAHAISGVVIDLDGHPFPKAAMVAEYHIREGAGTCHRATDAWGRFRFEGPLGALFTIRATDPAGGSTPAVMEDVPVGRHDLVLRLTPQRRCLLRVRDAADEPITHFSFRSRTVVGTQMRFGDLQPEIDRPAGEATVILDGTKFWLEVRSSGFETTVLGPFDPETVASFVDATLKRMPGLHGRVTSGSRPVVGARVSAHSALGAGERTHVRGFGQLVNLCEYAHTLEFDSVSDTCLHGREATTDEDGRFRLDVGVSGAWHVRVESEDDPTRITDAIDVAPDASIPDLLIDLAPRGAIAGFVRFRDGQPAPDALVGASCGDGLVLVTNVDTRGAYRFLSLAPGGWQVRVLPPESELGPVETSWSRSSTDAVPIRWDCFVLDGGKTRHDLDLPESARPR